MYIKNIKKLIILVVLNWSLRERVDKSAGRSCPLHSINLPALIFLEIWIEKNQKNTKRALKKVEKASHQFKATKKIKFPSFHINK
jgi:hypothetical protein